ncbi:protein of unknown function [endosymbiont DhMRE of Dentiscutata heterogama]|uniref:hypothetical protein n=1 Tax=endosymbiont DhMRE of Dentiscutata heterogama TaxID=1609546 RepID=UPI000629D317|nr:hypothetical protein [endosymbiont DhMRE of Dentiscutata heterogama]CFW93126.1 protein of unknown function [endosymbiont DhMRE of Dentiscutata heterogama]
MTQEITNKEYLRNIIISGLEGKKINERESEELIKTISNLNQTEWRNFKIVSKEILKEWIDEKITTTGQIIPSNLQNEMKNLLHAYVDLVAAVFSQEILQESVRLAKEKNPRGQQMLSLVPLYTRQLNKIAANKKTRKLDAGAYHKAEKSLVKKVNQLKSMAINTAFTGKSLTGQQAVEMVKKVIDLFKNLSADEIYVAKEKAKSLIAEYLNNYAPTEFRQYPQLKELSSSVINFLDALLDEELLAEAVKLTAEVCEIAVEKFDLKKLASFDKLPPKEAYKKGYEYGENIMKETLLQASLKANLENRARSLLVNLTNHINRLANEEVNNNVSTSEKQSITQRFSTSRQLHDLNNNPAENTGTGLSFISPVNTFGSVSVGNGNSGGLSWVEFLGKSLDKFTTVESKGKWYQNPWFIGFSIVGVLAVGGLAVWLLMRGKKKKVVYQEDNRW